MRPIVEGFRSVLQSHQSDKPDIRDGDEWKHTKSMYYMHNRRYTFGSESKVGTNVRELEDPGYVDETPCPRCPECGWGIDFGEGEEPQMKCSHCGSKKPARWRDE